MAGDHPRTLSRPAFETGARLRTPTIPKTTMRMIPFLAGCAALSSCVGGNAPGDLTPPSILAAAFLGAGAVPVAGDLLRLTFSED